MERGGVGERKKEGGKEGEYERSQEGRREKERERESLLQHPEKPLSL